ncbi:hypothetical protein [Streptomyces sp. PA5.6]|uniref:hypothetical protein n=1 Tax=Streptomyces sp. PA5.6 TaxID=3035651 RepID=UPI00390462A4
MAWQDFLSDGEVVALATLTFLTVFTRALAPAASLCVVGWLQILQERERRATITTALPHGMVVTVHDGGRVWQPWVIPPRFLAYSRGSVR